MTNEIENSENKTRRTALKNVAQVAVTAPAVSLLLDAATMSPAVAAISASTAKRTHVLDDYQSGNTHEDLGPGLLDDASLVG